MNPQAEVPEPGPDEAAHSACLIERIRAEIEDSAGWISFARYMDMALYSPGLGYYSAGAQKLGPAGDFVTAPEVAPVFSRCLATQCTEILQELGGGDLLELGAGSGIMAATMLEEFGQLGVRPARYRILDVSADLRQRQRATLLDKVPEQVESVEWLDAMPESVSGVVIANEVIDAMPVERFVIRGGRVNSLGVSWHFGRLDWAETRAGELLEMAVRAIEESVGETLPEGYTSEVNIGLEPWLTSLGRSIERGVLLFVDYGLPRRAFYAPERRTGTLLCHYRHRFHDDPFLNPGLQDITAWVDFTAVADAAEKAGLSLAGFTTQAHFLIGNDIEHYLSDVSQLELPQRLNLSRQAMVLTLPGEMGERFKVMALAKEYDSPLRGFSVRDLRHTL
jgi:SAM-dependent MidA family methyltransferase